MEQYIKQFNEMIGFVLKKDVIVKKNGEEINPEKKNINIEIGPNYKLFFETNETDDTILQEMKACIERILLFEIRKQEEQMVKHARENFINDVVHFRFDNIDSMLSRSEILDFDFYIKRTAVIIEIQDMYLLFKDKNELILQQLKESMYSLAFDVFGNDKDIISYAGSNRFVICKAEDTDMYEKITVFYNKLKSGIDVKIKIAIGDSYDLPGIEGMGYSYRDAEKYLAAGKRFLPEDDLYRFDNVGIFLAMSNVPKFERDKLLKYTKKLIEYDEKNKTGIKEFLEHLFVNNLAISKTEEELNIPKNKGKSMLAAVKETTGLEPTKFEDAVKLYISLKLLK